MRTHHARMACPNNLYQDIKVRSIPTALWRRVHAAILERNTTIRQFVIDALRAHLDRETTT